MNLAVGLADLAAAWKRRQVALYFARTETLARYRRSVLGPLWLVLSNAIGVAGLGLVWSALLKVEPRDFVPSLTVGLVTWQLIAGALQDGATVFSKAAGSILNIKLPTFYHALQLLFRHLINLGHNLVIVAVIFLIYPDNFGPLILLSLPGLLIVSVSLLGVIQFLGFVGARFRDIEPLVASFLPILFFLSPVIYQARQLGTLQYIMEFNVVAHWIRLIRDPALGMMPGLDSYLVAIGIMVVIWAAALWLTSTREHRLPYWV